MEGRVSKFNQLTRQSFLAHVVLPMVMALTLTVGVETKARAANVVYDFTVDVLGVNATGTITTDGTTGSLTASNVIDWNIMLGSYSTLNRTNSVLTFYGPSLLTATASTLTWDFSPQQFISQLYFSYDYTVGSVSYSNLFKFSNSPPPYQYSFVEAVVSSFDQSTHTNQYDLYTVAYPTSPTVVATAAVPEPAVSAQLAAGLIGLSVALRRRMNKAKQT